MQMLKVLEKRRSVREYKDTQLNSQDQSVVDDYINSLPQIVDEVTVSLRKVENAEACYHHLNGYAGYNGIMITAPHYVIVTSTSSSHALKAGGYAGEWFILNLTKHDIGTCWISANHSEARIAEYINLADGEEVVGIIGYGYPAYEARIASIYNQQQHQSSTFKHAAHPHIQSEYTNNPVSGRMSVEEFVHIREWGNLATVERLEELAYDEIFYYMRLAPSSVNRQPWRFLIDRGHFILCVSREDGYDDDRIALLEAGIAMLYFEVAMHHSGFPGKWNFTSIENKYNIPEVYLIAGTYSFV